MEKRVLHAIKAKAQMYVGYMYWIGFTDSFNKFTKQKYLYVVRPIDDEEEAEWEGVVTTIRKRIEYLKDNMAKDNLRTQS